MTNIEKLYEQFNCMTEEEKITAHNIYCDSINDFDNHIYSMDEFEEVTECIGKYELVRMIFNGNFNPNDDWFGFNGYGNLVSYGYALNVDNEFDISGIIADAINNTCEYPMFDFDGIEE